MHGIKYYVSGIKRKTRNTYYLIHNTNQSGIAQILIIILLLAGIALAVFLVGQRTNLFPQAASEPVAPDNDGDHWTDAQEIFIGTDPLSACSSKNKKTDSWPPDTNNNGIVNQSDYKHVRNEIRKGQYVRRYDLTADGKLNQDDLDTLKKYLGIKCNGSKGSAGNDPGDSGN